MRTNSGNDQGRDVNRDPTMKEHERVRGKSGATVLDANANPRARGAGDQRTTGMGSHARKARSKADHRIR